MTYTRPFALLSVHDKTGLVDFARQLLPHFALLASGGTARALRTAGLEVALVEDLTGFPELLGGRVKTLHPAIHAGLLSRRTAEDTSDLKRFDLPEIGLVAVSLYPFEQAVADPSKSVADRIEEIDIGGVALLRAAAKNHNHVLVVPGPEHYEFALSALHGEVALPVARLRLAALAMQRTAAYDTAISRWLTDLADASHATQIAADLSEHDKATPLARRFPDHRISQTLRYGENPHQSAVFLEAPGLRAFHQHSGKELSYNNLLDLDAAWVAVSDFEGPTCVVVKHGSPCGIATAPDLTTAVRRAIAADPVSAFGGILVTNRPFTAAEAEALGDLFLEIVGAPTITPDAATYLSKIKKNCRVLTLAPAPSTPVARTVLGGLLVQTPDDLRPAPDLFRLATPNVSPPLDQPLCAFAWSTVKHVKSNAITIATRDGEVLVTAGIGGGQTNRIDAVRQAIERAHKTLPDLANAPTVLASDAFFPFADGIEAAARAGIKTVIQPGGAIRDAEVIATAAALGVTLVLTGRRHFRH